MHIGYLVLAVRNLLREKLSSENFPANPFRECDIDVTPGGQPPPAIGEKFIGIYGTDWSPTGDHNTAIIANMAFSCVLTYRTASTPKNKIGSLVYSELTQGMALVCWQIAKVLDKTGGSTVDIPVFRHLGYLPAYVPGSIFEYPRWEGTDPEPVEVGADWFMARNEHIGEDGGRRAMGYTMTVRFGGVKGGHIHASG